MNTAAAGPVEMTDQFEATVVWLHEEPGLPGRSYDLKLATQDSRATLSRIKHQIDVNTLEHHAARTLELNDIARCQISLSRPVSFAAYEAAPAWAASSLSTASPTPRSPRA